MAGVSWQRKWAVQTAARAAGDQGARARKRERPASERPKQTVRCKPEQVATSRQSSSPSSTVTKYGNWGWLKQERKRSAKWRKRRSAHIMGVGIGLLRGRESVSATFLYPVGRYACNLSAEGAIRLEKCKSSGIV